MADTRQFTDHNEIGGVNVYLEDKKLAESPEQNTVASTDYVLLKDKDNIPRKISKANLMSVVKDAIGELLKSNDLGTSVTNVPALNASAFGSATVANLASVLGVASKEIFENNYNLNDAPVGIVKSYNADIVESLQNAPTPSLRANFMCETQQIDGTYRFQTFWYTSATWTAPKIYVRFKTQASGWVQWSAIIS